jgi:nucleotide-binding universal stress UspA family protein
MVRRILVALSGTPLTPIAVEQAVELAQRHQAAVTGVTVVDLARLADVGPIPLGGGAAAHSLAAHRVEITQERVEQEIANFEKACRNASISYIVDRETGDPFDRLLELWRYHDLTIIGLRGLFEYGVVHNPDDQVIRLIARGVRPIIAVSGEHRPVNRVLIAYNGSMESAMAMKRFAQMRLWPDVTVKIACFGFDDDKALPLLADATAYLRAHGLEPEAESLPGYPKEGLLKHAAEWKADMVVMGSTSRSRIMKLVMGETALEALMHAGEPLFLSQ